MYPAHINVIACVVYATVETYMFGCSNFLKRISFIPDCEIMLTRMYSFSGNYEHPTAKMPIEPQAAEDYAEIVNFTDETHSYHHGTTELEIPAEYKQGDPDQPEIQNILNVNNRGYKDYANYSCIVNKI